MVKHDFLGHETPELQAHAWKLASMQKLHQVVGLIIKCWNDYNISEELHLTCKEEPSLRHASRGLPSPFLWPLSKRGHPSVHGA